MQNSTNIRVPKKYHAMIEELFHEDGNGYIVHLAQGFEYDGSQTIIEPTQKDVLEAISLIEGSV